MDPDRIRKLESLYKAARVFRETLRQSVGKFADPEWREKFPPAADQTEAAWRDLSQALDNLEY